MYSRRRPTTVASSRVSTRDACRLVSRGQQDCRPTVVSADRVGQATCLRAAWISPSSNSGSGRRPSDRQLCPREVWLQCPKSELRRRTIGSSTGLRPVRGETSAVRIHGPANGSWLFGVGFNITIKVTVVVSTLGDYHTALINVTILFFTAS